MFEFQYDLVLMSLVIFVPTLFALALIFFPRGSEEWMRWWSLLGTAVTLVLSLAMFIDYYGDVVDRYRTSDKKESSPLSARAEAADSASEASRPQGQSNSDWVARYPWIPNFNIDYYLGVDGISMPLLLLTTVLSFLAMLASWKIDRFVR